MKLMVCVYKQYHSGKSSIIQETTFTRTTFVLARTYNRNEEARQTREVAAATPDRCALEHLCLAIMITYIIRTVILAILIAISLVAMTIVTIQITTPNTIKLTQCLLAAQGPCVLVGHALVVLLDSSQAIVYSLV